VLTRAIDVGVDARPIDDAATTRRRRGDRADRCARRD
jgi:hypothetical protein